MVTLWAAPAMKFQSDGEVGNPCPAMFYTYRWCCVYPSVSSTGRKHSQDWSAIVAHIPGLKVMFPATPYDAKGMLNLALRERIQLSSLKVSGCIQNRETLVEGGVPTEYYEVEMGEPALRRQGKDLTIVTVGPALYAALEAAEELEEKRGISAEVIDTRFINPLNYASIVESVKKTGRVVLASDACERCSFSTRWLRISANWRLTIWTVLWRWLGAQLDYASCGIGSGIFPGEGLDYRYHPRARLADSGA